MSKSEVLSLFAYAVAGVVVMATITFFGAGPAAFSRLMVFLGIYGAVGVALVVWKTFFHKPEPSDAY